MEGEEAARRVVLNLGTGALELLLSGEGREAAAGLKLTFGGREEVDLQPLGQSALPLVATLLTLPEGAAADAEAFAATDASLARDTSFASFLPVIEGPAPGGGSGEAEGAPSPVEADGGEAAPVARLVLGVEEGYQRAYREAASRGFGEVVTRAAVPGEAAPPGAGPGETTADAQGVVAAGTADRRADEGLQPRQAAAPDDGAEGAGGVSAPEGPGPSETAGAVATERDGFWPLAGAMALLKASLWLQGVALRGHLGSDPHNRPGPGLSQRRVFLPRRVGRPPSVR
jgi:hypothetical protein